MMADEPRLLRGRSAAAAVAAAQAEDEKIARAHKEAEEKEAEKRKNVKSSTSIASISSLAAADAGSVGNGAALLTAATGRSHAQSTAAPSKPMSSSSPSSAEAAATLVTSTYPQVNADLDAGDSIGADATSISAPDSTSGVEVATVATVPPSTITSPAASIVTSRAASSESNALGSDNTGTKAIVDIRTQRRLEALRGDVRTSRPPVAQELSTGGAAVPRDYGLSEPITIALPPGEHVNQHSITSVHLLRDRDDFPIPYTSLYGITLISALRLGLESTQRDRLFQLYLKLPLYEDMAPWNIVLMGSVSFK